MLIISEDRSMAMLAGEIRELEQGNSLAKLIDELPLTVKTLQLESPGGRLDVALEIAVAVQRRGLNTYVNVRCHSACTFIYIAGKNRIAHEYSEFVFHRIQYLVEGEHTPGVLEAYWQGRASQFYLDHGMPADLVSLIEEHKETKKDFSYLKSINFVSQDSSLSPIYKNGELLYPESLEDLL